MSADLGATGRWVDGELASNVQLGAGTLVKGDFAFKRFHSTKAVGLVIGEHCTMDGVQFAVGSEATVSIGDYSYFTNAVLLAELELRIGSYVMIGWNTTLADSDFHPIAPAQRLEDAIACSPLADRPRPPVVRRPVIIEDDVWIGPSATILKGVTVGEGAIVQPGSVLTEDVAPEAVVMGNPARVVGTAARW
ncbi:MAG: acyltransferase [Actinomycetota bacterium]|nr:acyltransferase [Actinomycetota bacterium]